MNFSLSKVISKVDPVIRRIAWDPSMSCPTYEFEAEVSLGPFVGVGRGLSMSKKDAAIEIAVTEGLERIAASTNGFPTSNGIAGHFDGQLAARNAIYELLERSAFLSSFYSGKIVGLKLNPSLYFENFMRNVPFFTSTSVLIGIAKSGQQDVSIVLNFCRVKKSKSIDGVILGLGCDNSIESAKNKAELETLKLCNYVLSWNYNAMSLDQFLGLDDPTFEDHAMLALHPTYFKRIESVFETLFHGVDVMRFSPEVSTTEIFLPPEGTELGLVFSKASSSEIIELFPGTPKKENLRNIREVLEKNNLPIDESLLCLPQPLA